MGSISTTTCTYGGLFIVTTDDSSGGLLQSAVFPNAFTNTEVVTDNFTIRDYSNTLPFNFSTSTCVTEHGFDIDYMTLSLLVLIMFTVAAFVLQLFKR